jgi:hypothetical protein
MENQQLLDVKGLPVSYTYRLTLCFRHEDQDLSRLPEKLSMAAVRLWKAGDEYVRPNGTKTGTLRPKSACLFELTDDKQTDLSAGLSSTVVLLKPHRAYLWELVDSGIEAYLSVGWLGRQWNFGDWFDWQLMQDIADLRLSLDLDIYGLECGSDD